MEFSCQANGIFPIVDRENASDIYLVQQAFVVCNALRSEAYSYEKFLVEFKLLESMVVKVLEARDGEGYPDDLSYLEEGSDMFSRVYQTYLWAKFNVNMCDLSEEDFFKELLNLHNIEVKVDDPEEVNDMFHTLSDILTLLKKKYRHFEGIKVVERDIENYSMILDDF